MMVNEHIIPIEELTKEKFNIIKENLNIITGYNKLLDTIGIPTSYNENYYSSKWKKSAEPKVRPAGSRKQALEHLDSVFIDDTLKDEIAIRTAIPDLLEGTEPAHNGVILFGPPGTGKTVLLKAIANVYSTMGAYAKEISVSAIHSAFVGQFAQNIEKELQLALAEAKRTKKPSFLFFDEGSILAQNAAEGAASVSKHYQEVADVMKRYIGNEKMLVIGISTNMLSESFEEALTREGRLTSFFIGYPDTEQKKRMWAYFSEKYNIMGLTEQQAGELAEAIPAEQGAFIEEFCRSYRRVRRATLVKEKGYRTLVDAWKNDANITEEEVTNSIKFETLFDDLDTALKTKYARQQLQENENGKESIGFR